MALKSGTAEAFIFAVIMVAYTDLPGAPSQAGAEFVAWRQM